MRRTPPPRPCPLRRIDALRVLFRALARVPGTTRTFFKYQLIPLHFVETLQAAVPPVPWIFLYRNTIEVCVCVRAGVIRGYGCGGGKLANVCLHDVVVTFPFWQGMVSNFRSSVVRPCLTMKGNPLREVLAIAPNATAESDERYCAAYISTLRSFALHAYIRAPATGTFVNYANLKGCFLGECAPCVAFWILLDGCVCVFARTDIIEKHYHIPLTPQVAESVIAYSGNYSKSRTNPVCVSVPSPIVPSVHPCVCCPPQRVFVSDSLNKTESATPAMVEAAAAFNNGLFEVMEKLSFPCTSTTSASEADAAVSRD